MEENSNIPEINQTESNSSINLTSLQEAFREDTDNRTSDTYRGDTDTDRGDSDTDLDETNTNLGETNTKDKNELKTNYEGVEEEKEGLSPSRMKLHVGRSVKILLEHLNSYGVCVVDNFLGSTRGTLVLEEVLALHNLSIFQDGQLMSGGGSSQRSVRSDKITWTDGISPKHSPNLLQLVQLLDAIILTANRVPSNGELGKYRINGRTRIMVACYPGGGSHYVKHVDNPNKDGRVVTAIYYLNKDWDSKEDGGVLNIYSQVKSGFVAKVEPLFDRVVFFWSDSRNPHEVTPSHKPRFAVTVWYLDELEKKAYTTRKAETSNTDIEKSLPRK